MRNPYAAPSAELGYGTPGAGVAGVIGRVAALSAAFAAIVYYHDAISSFVGSHFVWFSDRRLRFSGLMVQAIVIEALVCLPLLWPISRFYGRAAIFASAVVAEPVVWRAITELPIAPKPPLGTVLIAFHGLCHFSFLVGGVAVFRRSIAKQHRAVQQPNAL